MASQTASKTPTKQRNSWTLVEEKEFLILCRELTIAEQLDNCVTSAGNEEVYSFIRDGLIEKGFEKREVDKIRSKYRKLKMKYNDVKDHNLTATGRSRKEWIHYTVADDVWGHRPTASAKVTDTDDFELEDKQENSLSLSNVPVQSISDNEGEPTVAKKIKLAGQAGSSKAVVKIQPGTKIFRKKKTEMNVMADNDKYFIDQMVELEKTRMEQQMKMERERLQAEIAAKEANIKFQREMMEMMMQMQMQQHPLQAPQPPPQKHFYDF